MRGMRRGGEGLSSRFEKDSPVARTAAWQSKSGGVDACLLLALLLRVPQNMCGIH